MSQITEKNQRNKNKQIFDRIIDVYIIDEVEQLGYYVLPYLFS